MEKLTTKSLKSFTYNCFFSLFHRSTYFTIPQTFYITNTHVSNPFLHSRTVSQSRFYRRYLSVARKEKTALWYCCFNRNYFIISDKGSIKTNIEKLALESYEFSVISEFSVLRCGIVLFKSQRHFNKERRGFIVLKAAIHFIKLKVL